MAHLSESAIPSTTANSMQVMKMCQAMAQNGHDVTLLTPATWLERLPVASIWEHYAVEPVFRVRWLPSPPPRPSYSYAVAAGTYCRFALRPRLAYARHLQSALVAASLGIPVVFEAHDVPSASGRMGFALFERLARHPRFVRLVVISHALKEFFLSAWPALLAPTDVVVAPDAVDLERFVDLPPPPVARDELGVGDGRSVVVGYAGHLYPGRGIDLLVELASRCPDVRFLVVGGEPDHVQGAEEKARRTGARNVTFRGFVPNSEIPMYLAACDVLLMPHQKRVTVSGGGGDISRWMSPLKMFEYLAAGRPLIASDLPVLREVLTSDNAVLVPPEDVEAWYAALNALVADEARRSRLASAARETAASFTWRERAARCLDVPARALNSGPRGPRGRP